MNLIKIYGSNIASGIVISTLLSLVSCDKQQETPLPTKQVVQDPHMEAIASFQSAQMLFKDTLATIKDEDSYKAAKPQLQEILITFQSVATRLKKLDPPSPEQQKQYSERLIAGDSKADPTAGEIKLFLSIDQKKSEAYLTEFIKAGQNIGRQFDRLYGRYSHNKPQPADPEIKIHSTDIEEISEPEK